MANLFPWWKRYPNVNDEILNLDWLLYTVKKLSEEVSDFINLNTIKYADPILWDITSQYEANTIVVDPQTGDAYISVQAVPYGVSLSNTSYWTKIYNYADAINGLEEQIAVANEKLSTTATASRAVGDLVWLNGVLYIIISYMNAGDAYVEGSNCTQITIEQLMGNLALLDTSNQSSLVDAINEVLSNVGDLSSLNTSDKDSTVDAINEVLDTCAIPFGINVKDIKFPGLSNLKGDNSTDDTAALQALIDYLTANSIWGRIRFPRGKYIINGTINVNSPHIMFEGEEKGAVELTTTDASNTMFDIKANFITFRDLAFWVRNGDSSNSNTFINASNGNNKLQIENCMFYDAKFPINISGAGGTKLINVTVAPNTINYDGAIGIYLGGTNASSYIINTAINEYGNTNATCLKIEGKPSDLFIDGLETARGQYAIDMTCDNTSNPIDIKFTNLVLDEPVARGIYLHDLTGSENRFSMSISNVNIMPYTVGSLGVYISNCVNIGLYNINVHNNHQANTMSAFTITNSKNIIIDGGEFVDITKLASIFTSIRNITLANLKCFNVNKSMNGIELQTSRACLIQGCSFYGDITEAIKVTSGCIKNIVVNNVITADSAVTITDNGTDTVVANNVETTT